MSPARLIVWLVTGLAAISTIACSRGPNRETVAPDSTSGPPEVEATSWQLSSYFADQALVTAEPIPPALLTFAPGGSLTGSTGCNTFTGSYAAGSTSLRITLGPVTQQPCPSVNAMAQNQALIDLLPKVASYRISSDSLALSATDTSELLRYGKVSPPLGGTSWKVMEVSAGADLVVLRASDPSLTARFGTDETFTGFGGCNQLSGPYVSDDSSVVQIGPVTSANQICPGNAGQLERQYTAALGRVIAYSVTADTLTLRNLDGTVEVVATRSS